MPDYSLFGDEHIRQYEETDGEVGFLWNDATCLVLTTTGRKSGEPRKFALIFVLSGDDYLLVASKGGAPEHPGWYLNLEANPEAVIQVKGDVIPVTARTASPEEKQRLWPIMLEQWPYYDEYQAKTDRDIPVVILSPR
jgi:deazaflavin-dependent oxidoreductase (nitroreductase family)